MPRHVRHPKKRNAADNPSPHAFADESLAPEVDQPLLDALAREELSEEQARTTYRLIAAFKSWSDAHAEAVARAFRERHAD